jgi:hypothetical protein
MSYLMEQRKDGQFPSLLAGSKILSFSTGWFVESESESIGDQGLIIICYVTNEVSML